MLEQVRWECLQLSARETVFRTALLVEQELSRICLCSFTLGPKQLGHCCSTRLAIRHRNASEYPGNSRLGLLCSRFKSNWGVRLRPVPSTSKTTVGHRRCVFRVAGNSVLGESLYLFCLALFLGSVETYTQTLHVCHICLH